MLNRLYNKISLFWGTIGTLKSVGAMNIYDINSSNTATAMKLRAYSQESMNRFLNAKCRKGNLRATFEFR
jgi:hypothetical protein